MDWSGVPVHLMAEYVSCTAARRIRFSLISIESPDDFRPNQPMKFAEMRKLANNLGQMTPSALKLKGGA